MSLRRSLIGLILIFFSINTHSMSLTGFASIGVGRSYQTENILDYGKNWTLKPGTVFGLQVIEDLSSQTQFTIQAISRGESYDHHDDFELDLDWFFLSHQLDESTRIRMGLLRLPLFLYSDTLSVGYTYPWVRPPIEFYSPVYTSIKDFKGGDISWLLDLPNSSNQLSVQLIAGQNNTEFNGISFSGEIVGSIIEFRKLTQLFRYAFVLFRTDQVNNAATPLREGFLAFSSIDPVFQTISEAFNPKNTLNQYHALSAQWDHKGWSFTSEFNWLKAPEEDSTPERTGWYLSSSYKINKFMPYAVVGYRKIRLTDALPNLINTSNTIIPTGVNTTLDNLRQAILDFKTTIDSSSYSGSVGFRYDFNHQRAAKIEIAYFDSTNELSAYAGQDTHGFLTTFSFDMVF